MTAENEQYELMKEMLELSIKSGRRLFHDYKHLLDQVSDNDPIKKMFQDRGEMWQSVFYPDNGVKDYLTSLHFQIRNFDIKLRVAEDKIEELKKQLER